MRKVAIGVLTLLLSLSGFAQNKSLDFYYIEHNRSTPVADLCDILQEVYDDADRYDDMAVIFYMPNYDDPLIVKMNLDGDNRQDFKDIISELRLKPAHEVYVDIDHDNILNLINEHDFIDVDGKPTYSSVTFCWYINPEFWQFGFNEELIASLYFILELDRFAGYVRTQIWHAKGDGIKVDGEQPFGPKNLCRDMYFMLYQY